MCVIVVIHLQLVIDIRHNPSEGRNGRAKIRGGLKSKGRRIGEARYIQLMYAIHFYRHLIMYRTTAGFEMDIPMIGCKCVSTGTIRSLRCVPVISDSGVASFSEKTRVRTNVSVAFAFA